MRKSFKKKQMSRLTAHRGAIGEAVVLRRMRQPPKLIGGVSAKHRLEKIKEKGFQIHGYARLPSEQAPRKILDITADGYLVLEGIEKYPTSPCNAECIV
ncbi:MAG: hypothetical protein JWL88_795 [Parcubacteria group bacterium]|nr:hypothetical protein [Parcubacteria group bacterium]